MSAVVRFVSNVVESVVDAVGDVVEAVVDVVDKAVEFVGNAVQAVIDDPLPTLLAIAGSFVGIPPMVTNAAITAARGGDLGDIALSVGTSMLAPSAGNAISSTLSSAIGDAIINETVSNVVVDGISRGLVSGTISEIKGGDFSDGFAGGFTGVVVGAGVGEITDFVRPEIAETMDSLGFDESTVNTITNAGTKALTSGLTAEITGRGSFENSFTNSLINTTANVGANYAASSISDQFTATEETEKEIVGAEAGNVADEEAIKQDLTDAWANRDVNAVNDLLTTNNINVDDARTMFDLTDDDVDMLSDSGVRFNAQDDDIKTTTDITSTDTNETFGTGAGIPDSLVDEIEVATGGFNTGTTSDVVSEVDTDYYTNDLSGGDSLSTITGDDNQSVFGETTASTDLDTELFGYGAPEDVADLETEYSVAGVPEGEVATEFEEPITDYQDQIEQALIAGPATGDLEEQAPIEEDFLFQQGRPVDMAEEELFQEEELPTRIAKTEEDPYKDLISSFTAPEQERPVDIYGEEIPEENFGLKELELPAGGLNAGLTQDTSGAGKGVLTGALNQILKPAIRQGITRTLTRPTTRQPVKKVAKAAPRVAPKKLSATQMAAMQGRVPAQKVDVSKLTPTKKPVAKQVDVATLSPLKDITSLSALLAGGKGQG